MNDRIFDFDAYQSKAAATAIYPKGCLSYLLLGLCGESGEAAEILKRSVRAERGLTEDERNRLALEIGDCLWYIANIARELNLSMSDVANANLAKLSDRKSRGVIEGKGDYR